MSDIDDLKAKHQVDHLILLVGGNPLPNAISGSLLVKPEGRITLLHSRSTIEKKDDDFRPNTEEIAKRLQTLFAGQVTGQVEKIALDNPADRKEIQSKVRESLQDEKGSFGLNYTGGTKAMSVHAYRAVEEVAIKKRKSAVFSYLDTHSRKMMVDEVEYNPEMGNLKYPTNSEAYRVGEFYVSLERMLALHGWKLSSDLPEYAPILLETSKEIAQLNTHHANEWLDYRKQYKEKGSLGATIARPTHSVLDKFWETFQRELKLPAGTDAATISTDYVKKTIGLSGPEKIREWLTAKWLESVSLSALLQCQKKHKEIGDVCMSLKPHRIGKSTNFELDCVAVRGYQLFAISCTVDDNPVATHHLIEVSVRARQIAGDAARICLVCNHGDPSILRDKILKSMDEGISLRVFGKKDIPHLDDRIEKWIEECISYS